MQSSKLISKIKAEEGEIQELKHRLEEIKKEAEDYKNKYLRALADYQNYDKRVKEEKLEFGKSANAVLLLQLLPFLDDLDKAEIFIKDQGLKMVKEKFYNLLKDLKVEEIQVLGKEFNPHLAHAIDTVEGEKNNIVVEVLRKGYMFNGKVLRVAQVKVSKRNLKH